MYKRILLKLSGEALSDSSSSPLSPKKLQDVALEIKKVYDLGVEICIVVGGGNIYRGKMGVDLGMARATGDSMGMLATVLNALAVSNALESVGVPSCVMTSISMIQIAEPFTRSKALSHLRDKKVVIFGGGTGNPYFSTDTCSALRALETNCDAILMAKNGVDGVYNADPRKNKNAEKFEEISYHEVISRNLQVMDQTAVSLCMENHVPLIVFNMNEPGNILKAALQEKIGTTIK